MSDPIPLFNINTWLGNFTFNLFSDAFTTIILGIFLFMWIDKLQRRKEKRENHKIIASLIAAELQYNQKTLKELIAATPKGDVIFPALSDSAWNSIDKPDFINFYKPQDLANVLDIYRRIGGINKMYDSLLEASNWAVSGRIAIVRKEFLDVFTKKCNELLNIIDDFFAGVERKREIKKNGLKYEGILVKQKPRICNLLPWISSYTAQAIYPNIYVSEEVYEDLTRIRSKAGYVAVLEHEKKHIERQKELGVFKFGIKYLFSPKFRFKEEILAIKASMKYLKKKGLDFEVEKRAKWLSSWLYLWMTSYDDAKKALQKAWVATK